MGRSVRLSWERHKFGWLGPAMESCGFPRPAWGLSLLHLSSPNPPFVSFQSYTAPSSLLSRKVMMWLPAEEQHGLGKERPF